MGSGSATAPWTRLTHWCQVAIEGGHDARTGEPGGRQDARQGTQPDLSRMGAPGRPPETARTRAHGCGFSACSPSRRLLSASAYHAVLYMLEKR